MNVTKETVSKMDARKLRYVAESEVNTSVYVGYDRDFSEATIEGKRTGYVYDVDRLLDSIAVLLQKYPDITIEKTENALALSGQPKTYSRDVECTPYIQFQYHDVEAVIQIADEHGVDAYCQQTELIDCLADTAIFHIMLLIQDDQKMKECYLEFLDLTQPYKNMLTEQKNAFLDVLITDTMDFLQDQPVGKVKPMPITLNLSLLVYQLKTELLSYDFEGTAYDVYQRDLTLYFRGNGQRFSISLDPATMNGLLIGRPTRIEFDFHLLDTEQVISLFKTLIRKLQEKNNVYCKMFAKKALASLYDLVYWDEADDAKDYKKIFEE